MANRGRDALTDYDRRAQVDEYGLQFLQDLFGQVGDILCFGRAALAYYPPSFSPVRGPPVIVDTQRRAIRCQVPVPNCVHARFVEGGLLTWSKSRELALYTRAGEKIAGQVIKIRINIVTPTPTLAPTSTLSGSFITAPPTATP